MKTLFLLLISSVLLWSDAIKTDTNIALTIKGVPAEEATGFNGPYTVYANGTINLPLIGVIKASGKTPDQLAKTIESLYRRSEIYTNPTVNCSYQVDDELDQKTITFRSQAGSKIIPYQRDMTLQKAIAAAGGAGTFDSKKRVLLERNSKEYEYDMKNIQHRNLKIYENDVIRLPHVNGDGWLKKIGFGD